MATKKEVMVAEQNGVELFSDEIPDFLKDKMNSCRGNEGMSQDDVIIPRLEVVQSLSACRKKNDPAYIEGADEGMLYNSVTRELYGESCFVVPVVFRKVYLLWQDLAQGGGFGGSFNSREEAESERSKKDKPDSWEVVDTHEHYCLIIGNDKSVTPIVMSMAKSKMKVSKKWNSLISLNGGDRFSRVYKVNGVADKNSANQDFYNVAVSNAGFVTKDLYEKAEKFFEQYNKGGIKTDNNYDTPVKVDGEDEDMPF